MAKPLHSAATEHALSVIAHVSMAHSLAKEVEGMAGFAAYYAKQMSPKDKKIVQRFEQLAKQAYRDLAEMMQRDMQANNGQ